MRTFVPVQRKLIADQFDVQKCPSPERGLIWPVWGCTTFRIPRQRRRGKRVPRLPSVRSTRFAHRERSAYVRLDQEQFYAHARPGNLSQRDRHPRTPRPAHLTVSTTGTAAVTISKALRGGFRAPSPSPCNRSLWSWQESATFAQLPMLCPGQLMNAPPETHDVLIITRRTLFMMSTWN
jgi:hypothetical protein